MAKIDLRHRRPTVQKLPDGRERATFVYEVREFVGRTKAEITAECWLAWGTAAPGDFSALRLVDQRLEGERLDTATGAIPLLRVFEEIPETTEVQVGRNEVRILEDGRKAIVAEFIQFAAAAATPGTVGTSTAPGDTSAFMQQEEAKNDGALRRIARTYVYAGTLSQSDQSKNQGKLLLRTIVSVKTAPATPLGYTLVDTDTKNPNGIPVYTYTFAKGVGRVFAKTSYKQKGKLKITTIRFLNTDDGATPAGELVDDDSEEQEGYTVVTRAYAEVVGDGITLSRTERKNKGKLVVYRIVRLATAPTAPSPTIGGTVVSVDTDTRQEDGVTVYDYTIAEGNGLIRTDEREILDGAVRYLTTLALGANVAATGEYETETEDREGVTLYTSRGIVIVSADLPDQVEAVEGTILTITTKRKINSAPSGTGSMIQDDPEPREGFTLYTRRFVSGTGTTTTEAQYEEGNLVITTTTEILALGATLPSLPSNVLSRRTSQERGYQRVVTRHISSGAGQTSYTEQTRGDGSKEYNVVRFDASEVVPTDPSGGSGYLVAKKHQAQAGGYFTNLATYIVPPPSITFRKQMNFSMPGLASFSGTELVLSPPTTRTVLASVAVSYGTTQDTTAPYSVDTWASFRETYKPTETGGPVTRSDGLGGYVGSGSTTGTNSTYRGIQCDSWAASISGSSPSARPTGSTVLSVDNDVYLRAIDGTVVYRRAVATYTF